MSAAAGPSAAASLRLSLATIRSRWASFAGAFFAIAGGVATRRRILGLVTAESLIAVVLNAVVAAASALPVLIVMLLGLTGLIGSYPVSVPWAALGAVTATCAVIGVLAAVITSALTMRRPAVELAGLRE
jgi:putative ABC transport system permease protein